MKCTNRLSLSELLARPMDLLVLKGADDNQQQGDPAEDKSEDKSKTGDESKDEKSGEPKIEETGKTAEPDPKDRKIEALEEEKDRHYDLRKVAEDKLAAALREISDLKKNGTTDEATKTRLTEFESSSTEKDATIKRLALDNAFLRDNTYNWVSADAALKLADMTRVEVEGNGKVSGLSSALEKLAKDNPWLLKAAEEPKVEKKEESKQKTGDAPQSKSSKSDSDASARDAELRKKYPALRR